MTKHFRKPAACLDGLTERESFEFKRLSETAPNADRVAWWPGGRHNEYTTRSPASTRSTPDSAMSTDDNAAGPFRILIGDALEQVGLAVPPGSVDLRRRRGYRPGRCYRRRADRQSAHRRVDAGILLPLPGARELRHLAVLVGAGVAGVLGAIVARPLTAAATVVTGQLRRTPPPSPEVPPR